MIEINFRTTLASIVLFLSLFSCGDSNDEKSDEETPLDFPLVEEPTKSIGNTVDSVRDISFTLDGKHILSGGYDGTIRQFSLETGETVRTFDGHEKIVTDFVLSADGKSIYSSSYDDTIRKWNLETGFEQSQVTVSGDVEDLDVSPDGEQIAAALPSGSIKIFNADLQEEKLSIDVPLPEGTLEENNGAYSIKFLPDGKSIVSGNNVGVTLWDAETGEKKHDFVIEDDPDLYFFQPLNFIRVLTLSPDGKYLAVSNNHEQIFVWNIETKEQVIVISELDDIRNESFPRVSWTTLDDLEFSSDGSKLFVGLTDTIRVYEVVSKTEVYRFRQGEYTGLIGSMAFSPDGKLLADAAGKANSIRIWDVSEIN